MKTADLVFDRSYINGEWVTAGNATFEVINPASGEVLARVADGGAVLTEKAIRAAEILLYIGEKLQPNIAV